MAMIPPNSKTAPKTKNVVLTRGMIGDVPAR
jgi:hypothetical protein